MTTLSDVDRPLREGMELLSKFYNARVRRFPKSFPVAETFARIEVDPRYYSFLSLPILSFYPFFLLPLIPYSTLLATLTTSGGRTSAKDTAILVAQEFEQYSLYL